MEDKNRKHLTIVVISLISIIIVVFLGILTGETTKKAEVIEEQIPIVDESATNEEIVEKIQEKTEEMPEEILKETLEDKQEIITETLEKIEEQTQLSEIALSSIGHNAPETNSTLKGRAKLYITLNKVYPNQRFYIFRKDSPVDVKVGDFYVDTVRSRCLQDSEGRYNDCKHMELLPLDGNRWSTGDYYIQAKAKINDPDGEYKAGELIGDKVYFRYIK